MMCPPEHKHNASCYSNCGCRCPACKYANRLRMRAARERRKASPIPGFVAHGKDTTYLNWGCRCIPCGAAHSHAMAEYHRRRKA